MKKIFGFFFIFLLLIAGIRALQLNLPVSEALVLELSISIKRLEHQLKSFGSQKEDKTALWKRTELTKRYLFELHNQLNKYGNVIKGAKNTIRGQKNVIIGNYNNIEGSNNWVFISKFSGSINGNLLISKWRIELDKSNLILVNPMLAISFIDQSKNIPLFNKFFSRNRKFCRWESWGDLNSKRYQHWNSYYGFDQFAKEWTKHSKNGGPRQPHKSVYTDNYLPKQQTYSSNFNSHNLRSENSQQQNNYYGYQKKHGGFLDLFGRYHEENPSYKRQSQSQSSPSGSSENSKNSKKSDKDSGSKKSKGSDKDSSDSSNSKKSKKSKGSDKDSSDSSSSKKSKKSKGSDKDSSDSSSSKKSKKSKGSDKDSSESDRKYTESSRNNKNSYPYDINKYHNTYSNNWPNSYSKNWGW